MPLLKREPEIHPESIFELPPDARWQVAHVPSRREKVLARHLLRSEIPFYVPQSEQKTRRAGRTFRSYLPLFPGYVFLRSSDEQRALVYRSNVIVSLLDVPDQQTLADELRQIRALQLAGASLEPAVVFEPGDPVKITEGAFRGYKGVVVRDRGTDRLIVMVSLIRKAVAVEFDKEVVAHG